MWISVADSRLIKKRVLYYFVWGALFCALALSTISWLRLCSQTCAEGHNYRIFGLTFETVGFIFFPLLLLTHGLSNKYRLMGTLTGWLICASLGAEVVFIYIQKYKIGSWCPICLLIAASIAFAGIAYLIDYYSTFKITLNLGNKEDIMVRICKGVSGIIFFVAGFLIAFSGVGKYSNLEALENSIKERIAFGKLDSHIEVFIFTDWTCRGCRALEPTLEAIAPVIMRHAKLTFVDDPVHPETMNFTPYNLSFMIHNKPHYFALRRELTALSEMTTTPSDQQVEALAAKLGLNYRQLNYSDIALASKYFKELVSKLKVVGTPTIVIVNTKNKKGKRLEGTTEINKENVAKAIDSLAKKP